MKTLNSRTDCLRKDINQVFLLHFKSLFKTISSHLHVFISIKFLNEEMSVS